MQVYSQIDLNGIKQRFGGCEYLSLEGTMFMIEAEHWAILY